MSMNAPQTTVNTGLISPTGQVKRVSENQGIWLCWNGLYGFGICPNPFWSIITYLSRACCSSLCRWTYRHDN